MWITLVALQTNQCRKKKNPIYISGVVRGTLTIHVGYVEAYSQVVKLVIVFEAIVQISFEYSKSNLLKT